MIVVSTSNGLLCMCNDANPDIDPAIREKLAKRRYNAPTMSRRVTAEASIRHTASGTTSPRDRTSCFDTIWKFDTVQVFNLWEKSWRDMATSSAVMGAADVRCRLGAGVGTVDGATYWVTESAEKIVSFDHENERVVFVKTASRPLQAKLGSFQLVDVRGRLGITVTRESGPDVWVLENPRGKRRWRRWYNMETNMPRWYHGWPAP
ncbi:hypothetical protein BRADI_4g11602v3 [Brachypodium distachyon]|uniref:F-box associated beta-propeller type 3 domain-containing protein n=1 Tax=Brachypodium distachyon TaxID=15368 RepID=A0A0Q3EIE4_BRADI|nr:hypothetical protein BRADI_4g11602v3 [Brachypodium distachyon]